MLPFETNRAFGRNLFAGVGFEDDESSELLDVGDPVIIIDNIEREENSPQYGNFLIIRDKLGQILISSLVKHLDYTVCGRIELPGGEKISDIYRSPRSGATLIDMKGIIPDHYSNKCAKLIIDLCPNLVLVFDSYTSSGLVADGEEDISNYLRIIQSTFTPDGFSLIVKPLDIGSVVDGLTAAIMCQAEYSKTPAISCFTVRHAAFSIRAAKAFECVWKLVQHCVGDLTLSLPDKDLYVQARNTDQYILKTEALYT